MDAITAVDLHTAARELAAEQASSNNDNGTMVFAIITGERTTPSKLQTLGPGATPSPPTQFKSDQSPNIAPGSEGLAASARATVGSIVPAVPCGLSFQFTSTALPLASWLGMLVPRMLRGL